MYLISTAQHSKGKPLMGRAGSQSIAKIKQTPIAIISPSQKI